ncbi:MAG: peptidylprolyl isomerase [Marinilabiliales bacterium]|nr:MAG: peptidylprolyl isomerase [Marinilabiliales bacterium]
MRYILLLAALLSVNLSNYSSYANPPKGKDKIVLIKTNYGNIKVKLYNQTPQHRDNFLKLVKKNFYDSLLFHRVIKDFMIQGGDPDSKNAKPEQVLGNGGPGYTIPAEFVPEYYHKKGALAAARQGDNVNPSKASSGSQFYIVQGRVFKNEDLDMMEKKMNQNKKTQILLDFLAKPENKEYKAKVDSLQKARSFDELNVVAKELEELTIDQWEATEKFAFSEKQREIYTTIGGTPHLDGDYTVFGEVIEGMDVIDKIASVKTGAANRPVEDIIMTMEIVKQ